MIKGVIMAGGKGTRLRPLTCGRPKPMVPVVQRPMMEYIVDLLVEHDIQDIAVTLCYMPDAIRNYFEDGSRFGARMQYYIEETPLGTAGSVKNAESYLDDTFVVISGDALTDIDLTQAIDYHRRNGAIATIVLTRVATPLEYGVVITDEDGRIKQFLEKPSWSEVFSDTVNTGIYILEPEIFSYFEQGQVFDFSKDLFPLLLRDKAPLYGMVASGYWSDIGNLEQYRESHHDCLTGKVRIRLAGTEIRPRVWVGKDTHICDSVEIESPVWIGENVEIKKGSRIGKYSVIGSNCILDAGSSIKRSIIWNDSYVGRYSQLRAATVCNHVSVKSHVAMYEGAVVGEESSIGENSVIRPQVKIWPSKTVDSGTVLTSSLIWSGRWSKRLFGNNGVSGLANVEITPDFAARLGAAYGATLDGGNTTVAVSADDFKVSRMIKRSLIAGLLSSGVHVTDLGKMTTPATRYATAVLDVQGGLHVRLSPYDTDFVLIEFLDDRGINIAKNLERKIENAFFGEDFKRAAIERIGELSYFSHITEKYLSGILESVNVHRIRSAEFKVAIDYCAGNLSLLFPTLLEQLGCEVVGMGPGFPELSRPRSLSEMLDAVSDVSKIVIAKNADIGVIVDDNAEKLVVIDEDGDLVSDEAFLALLTLIMLKSSSNPTVAVPVTAPGIIETLAKRYNGKVIRTKADSRSVMEKIIEEKILVGQRGLPGIQPVSDALFSFSKLLELMATESRGLSNLVAQIPEFYMSKGEIHCPWEDKGRVMRSLIEDTEDREVELLDGIKVKHKHGWALVLPDSEKPLFHIYSEGLSQEIAEELGRIYSDKINSMRQ